MIKFYHYLDKTIVYWVVDDPHDPKSCQVWCPDIDEGSYKNKSSFANYRRSVVESNIRSGVWVKVNCFQDYLKQVEQL